MVEITLGDGRVLEIDTDDMATAFQAAQAFVDREKARARIEAEDKQRGPIGNFMKNFSDGTNQLAANIPLVGKALDEANAALITRGGLRGNYGEELEYQRERREQAARRSPLATAINATVGSLAGGMGIVKATTAMAPARLTGALPKKISERIGAGAGIGASGSAVEGFAGGEGGFENRLATAARSAPFGGLAGGLAPALGAAAGGAWHGVASWLANRGVDAKSIKIMLEQLKANGYTPWQAKTRLEEMGREAMPADLTPGLQTFTGGTAISDPMAGNLIGQRLKTRREGAPARIDQVLDETLGLARDPSTQRQWYWQQRKPIRPKYENSLSNAPQLPSDTSDVLAKRVTGRSVEQQATITYWRDRIDGALQADTFENVARQLQSVKRELAGGIEWNKARRSNLSEEQEADQQVLHKLRSAVDDILKSRIPGYREADKAFAPIARQNAAYEKGRTKVLTNKVPAAEHQADVAGYSPEELAKSTGGMRHDFDRKVANPRSSPGISAAQILARDDNMTKIRASIGDAKTDRLRRGIEPERIFAETSDIAEPGRGSQTAVTDAARKTLGRGGRPNVLTRNSPALIRKTADNLTRTGTDREELVEALISTADAWRKRSHTAEGIRRVVEALALTQAGRAGYEAQRLVFGGPR